MKLSYPLDITGIETAWFFFYYFILFYLCMYLFIYFFDGMILMKAITYFVDNKAKGQISKRVLQKNKARQSFRKSNILYP